MRKRSDRTKSSRTRDDNDDSTIVPEELLIEILKRLPVKSLCRFSCVCTRWRSLISDPRFVDSHLAHSATRPKLLVSFPDPHADHREGGLWLLSADQSEPRNGQPQIATPHFLLRAWTGPYVSQSHDGLICREVGGHVNICNPSTGKHAAFRIPGTTARSAPWSYFEQTHSFGYDPVERKHKVLSTRVISKGRLNRRDILEPRVLTLGTKRWRRVEGCAPHYKKDREFCFDGVVYYTAWSSSRDCSGDMYLVAFDVRMESFRMITVPARAHEFRHKGLLIEFEGRLAIVDCYTALSCAKFYIWILEDFDREIWKKRVFVLPRCWKEMVGNCQVFPAGMVRSGELLFAPQTLSKPVCVFYYNLKTNGFRRSEICGLPEHDMSLSPAYCLLTFSDYVESLLPLGGLSSRN
ncbi:putative F-box protein At2g19630 [Syzygium oleosum]|uniref:putative F-box protein At2g19630 n=1 Tax=Syzygium oleosum TaxID=219896 RepID=UPI0024B9C804|nr:putative F-box protein At2g19630 [Syzygium oleosum]